MKPVKNQQSEDEDMSEDEEAASPAASEEDEELSQEEEEEEEEEMEKDKEMEAEENSASEDSLDGDKASDRHPYPTPPPDDGSKMAPLDLLVKSQKKVKSEVTKKKLPFIDLAIMAIENLKDRSGSSLRAIMKYLRENGYPWEDEKRQIRTMSRALKMGVATGKLEMVKLSYKVTQATKTASIEKMKQAKEKQKEKLKKSKAQEKEKKKAMKKKTAKKAVKGEAKAAAKKEKPGKPSERKTNQATKKKKTENGTKDVPPKAKTAASVAARALLDTPTNDEMPVKKAAKAKAKANSSEAGKSKKPRKSIGTLAQTKTTVPKVKAVKKLVAAKTVSSLDKADVGKLSEAQATSTPQAAPSKGRTKRKL
ncbi:histone H1, early embryonic [Drosophila kikkawai]|uniref:Histone H1, early embryonic n=1 Tax=Drosophila kikkawai TaxID=30033 RepID=A0A6P4ISV0_DROKI|nr:histone H1 [Drosophila kikkawai]